MFLKYQRDCATQSGMSLLITCENSRRCVSQGPLLNSLADNCAHPVPSPSHFSNNDQNVRRQASH
jgi:hypothetical protein